jgi:hypothetical protein
MKDQDLSLSASICDICGCFFPFALSSVSRFRALNQSFSPGVLNWNDWNDEHGIDRAGRDRDEPAQYGEHGDLAG